MRNRFVILSETKNLKQMFRCDQHDGVEVLPRREMVHENESKNGIEYEIR